MILYIENTNDSNNQKILDLISEFGKIAGYKVNTQKSIAFLYTNNELSEIETKKILFIIATKTNTQKIRCIGINLPRK